MEADLSRARNTGAQDRRDPEERELTCASTKIGTELDAVYLAHPLKVRVIADARIKTDRIDSRILAPLLRCDLLPTA